MTYSLRPLVASDAHETARIINQGQTSTTSVEVVHERITAAIPGRVSLRIGAWDAAGTMVGYGHLLRDDYMERGLFWAHIAVDEAHRRHGLGRLLHSALREFGSQHGATLLRSEVHDDDPGSLAFARACGYQVSRHIFESVLDLNTVNQDACVEQLERIEATGVTFFSLAHLGDTREARMRLWELERTVALDIPGGSEAATRPFDVWERQVTDSTIYIPDAQIIAAVGETWVGMAALLRTSDPETLYHGMTGVLREHRGKGIATAVKMVAILVAIMHGAAQLRTNNDSENAPILAVNRKLGYQPEPGYYRIEAAVEQS